MSIRAMCEKINVNHRNLENMLEYFDECGDCFENLNNNYVSLVHGENLISVESSKPSNLSNSSCCDSDELTTILCDMGHHQILSSYMNDTNFYNDVIIMEFESIATKKSFTMETKLMGELNELYGSSKEAIVVTADQSPFCIRYVNKAWEELCQYKSSEVVGKTSSVIQGPLTNINELKKLNSHFDVSSIDITDSGGSDSYDQEEFQTTLINYKKTGEYFRNHLKIVPLHHKVYGKFLVSGLSSVLKKFLSITQDIKRITISTSDGIELISESRLKAGIDETSSLVSAIVPSFVTSSDQSQRLGLGTTDHSLIWLSNGFILLQKSVQGLILSIILEESANIGLVEEYLGTVEAVLKPFCSSFVS